jgi:ArsR family transcriptional regulator
MRASGCGDAELGQVALVPDGAALEGAVLILKGFADPTRLRILALLRAGEVCVHDIVAALQMTQSAISHQLRLLREARLVLARRAGRHVFYRLADAHVERMLADALLHGAETAAGGDPEP